MHVSRGVTTHGFAINVNNDLQPFEWIVPCGIEHCQMSSVTRETGRAAEPRATSWTSSSASLPRVYGRDAAEVDRATIERGCPLEAVAA